MKQLKCEVGERYGLWEVIDNKIIVKSGHRYVLVKCACGKKQLSCLSDLKSSRTSSCKSCSARVRRRKVEIGNSFKEWLVINGPKVSQRGHVLWQVECSCKTNTRWMQANELTSKTRCLKCINCAAMDRGFDQTKRNGRIGNLTKTKYSKVARTAKARNIPFVVSMNFLWQLYLKQGQKCAITGDKLCSITEASLDRIDSSKGYTEDNVQWVSKQANLSKHLMSMQELQEFCKKVLNNANQQPSVELTIYEGSETNS